MSPRTCILALAVLSPAFLSPLAAQAQEVKQGRYYELESKYLFGFTDGTDIGAQGEKEVEFETTGSYQAKKGRFSATEQEIEFEHVPSQYWGYEFSAHALSQQISGVPGQPNLSQANFSGLSWKPKWLIVGREPGNPVGLSLSVQPEWERIDGDSGAHASNFSLETRLAADTELVSNMLYAATNLIYLPEITRSVGDRAWGHGSSFGVTGALAYRIAPKVTLGGELEYYRAYDGLGFNSFNGAALYAGPTLHVQFEPKIFLALAWSSQIAGHAVGDSASLDLTNFQRQRVNLKFGYEF